MSTLERCERVRIDKDFVWVQFSGRIYTCMCCSMANVYLVGDAHRLAGSGLVGNKNYQLVYTAEGKERHYILRTPQLQRYIRSICVTLFWFLSTGLLLFHITALPLSSQTKPDQSLHASGAERMPDRSHRKEGLRWSRGYTYWGQLKRKH